MCGSWYRELLRKFVAIKGGVLLAEVYYICMLQDILPGQLGTVISVALCVILGVGNALSRQLRCISVLVLPMYCGKPGRGALKAVLLTYIVAGPISNMCRNAGEVVRVFACTNQLAQNLSLEQHSLMLQPLRMAALGVAKEVEEVKDTFRSYQDIVEPLERELVDGEELAGSQRENDFIDDLMTSPHRSQAVDEKFYAAPSDIVALYKKKLAIRCENQISRAVSLCIVQFSSAYVACAASVPRRMQFVLCWPLKLARMCNLTTDIKGGVCDCGNEVPQGLERAYYALERIKTEIVDKTIDTHLQYKANRYEELQDGQDAKETAERVLQAFAQKTSMIRLVNSVIYICTAVVMLRIFSAAVSYHELYLQDIDFDNVYLTRYFKVLDTRRKITRQYVLLPLKKMERNKYVDVHSLSYRTAQRQLVSQILKVLLEVVTTTTFVMLDRLFYEALDVVRQYAEKSAESTATRDLEIAVEGSGLLGTAYRILFEALQSRNQTHTFSNQECLPRPKLMPCIFFFKIYGGYLWILLLLLINPYTARLCRSICAYFYPRREKQRILHLYNDILKKRMKMNKTLRRKAVQSVRSHYLTGESLLSLRMKFPQLLGWLKVLPAARMTCLICDEVEPRSEAKNNKHNWYTCIATNCPFIYCAECWFEAGRKCLACDPSLAEMSDVDSLTDDERPAY